MNTFSKLNPNAFLSALDDGLMLYQQPIVYANGSIAYEILLRKKLMDGCIVSAYPLVAQMESEGSISLLDRVVIKSAFSSGCKGRRYHINVSPITLNLNGAFIGYIEKIAAEYSINPALFVFEIIERPYIEFHGYSAVKKLQRMGFDISFDDFGKGHPLDALYTIRPASIKVDLFFIQRMQQDVACLRLVKSMVSQGHAVGASVIAEGVETESEYRLCEQIGFDGYQGWYFGQGQPLDCCGCNSDS